MYFECGYQTRVSKICMKAEYLTKCIPNISALTRKHLIYFKLHNGLHSER